MYTRTKNIGASMPGIIELCYGVFRKHERISFAPPKGTSPDVGRSSHLDKPM